MHGGWIGGRIGIENRFNGTWYWIGRFDVPLLGIVCSLLWLGYPGAKIWPRNSTTDIAFCISSGKCIIIFNHTAFALLARKPLQ